MSDRKQLLITAIAEVELPVLWRFALQITRDKHDALSTSSGESIDIELGCDNVTPETRLEFDEVVSAVEALPEAQRLVMQLVCAGGFSYAETASILEIPVGTVMSRLARARMAIGEQFLDETPTVNVQEIPRTSHSMPISSERQL